MIVAFGSAPDPAWTLMRFVLGILAPDAPASWTELAQARLLLAGFALSFATLGARRVTAGATGWMASLPVDARTARRAAWAASVMAALPVMVFLAGALVLATTVYRATPRLIAMATLPLLLAAAGATALRVRAWWARVPAALALLAATRPDLAGLMASLALLALWDRTAGRLAPPKPVRHPSRRSRTSVLARRVPRAGAHALAVRWAWRVAGARAAVEGLLLAAVPVGFAALARRNNADLAQHTLDVIGRLGAGLGVTAVVAATAGALLARRAPWPWPRSLPWGARDRVLADAVALLLPVLPVMVATTLLFGAASLPASVGVALVAVPSAACALRAGARRQTGAAGEPALLGALAAALLMWWPLLALAMPLAAWLLLRRAVQRDRDAAGATRWDELRHDLASDTMWISRT